MITQRVIEDGQIAEFAMNGDTDADETVRAIESDVYRASSFVLWDCERADLGKFEFRDIARIAQVANQQGKRSLTALVGASDLTFGMLRMYQSHAESEGGAIVRQVFRKRDEAIRWLLGGVQQAQR